MVDRRPRLRGHDPQLPGAQFPGCARAAAHPRAWPDDAAVLVGRGRVPAGLHCDAADLRCDHRLSGTEDRLRAFRRRLVPRQHGPWARRRLALAGALPRIAGGQRGRGDPRWREDGQRVVPTEGSLRGDRLLQRRHLAGRDDRPARGDLAVAGLWLAISVCRDGRGRAGLGPGLVPPLRQSGATSRASP
jgi:hypothetical protein